MTFKKLRGHITLSSTPVIDTHAHMCDPVFDSDRKKLLDQAAARGIRKIIAVGENLSDARKNIDLASVHSEVLPTAGLYPTLLEPDHATDMVKWIRTHALQLIAIGEVGLDYWVVKEERDRVIQRDIFRQFIDLSIELDLPLNVHSRSAGAAALEILIQAGATRVQMHAFDGKAATAMKGVDAGYFFSIPPSVIRSRQKQKIVSRLPLNSLLVETDSPVLGPNKDKRNTPANIVIAINAIAAIKKISPETVQAALLANTCRLYGDIVD